MAYSTRSYSLLVATIGLATASVHGQDHEEGRPSAAAPAPAPAYERTAAAGAARKVSDLLGATVHAQSERESGTIHDLIVADGEIVAAVVAVGGFFGIGADLVEVPYSQLRPQFDGDTFLVPELGIPADAAARAEYLPPLRPDPVPPLQIDEELAEIDPRLAEGIAASEEAYGEALDHKSYDDDANGESQSPAGDNTGKGEITR